MVLSGDLLGLHGNRCSISPIPHPSTPASCSRTSSTRRELDRPLQPRVDREWLPPVAMYWASLAQVAESKSDSRKTIPRVRQIQLFFSGVLNSAEDSPVVGLIPVPQSKIFVAIRVVGGSGTMVFQWCGCICRAARHFEEPCPILQSPLVRPTVVPDPGEAPALGPPVRALAVKIFVHC